jgi:chemotaxis protein CheD
MVRMGELATSGPGHMPLVCIGLGSCIGLVLFDRAKGSIGLSHVMLPDGPEAAAKAAPAKYGTTAVPALLEAMGATATRVEAVLVGGASMFAAGAGSQEVGQRNQDSVRKALAAARIAVVAAEVGGNRGRTVRVVPGAPGQAPSVAVRCAGDSADHDLPLPPRSVGAATAALRLAA